MKMVRLGTNLKISTSITDFAPLFLDLEYLFQGLKNTGVDGLELQIGLKSRWSVDKIKRLSQKYDLPITSIHQPLWAGLGILFDEGFFDIADYLGASTVVCHPLPRYSFEDSQMRAYLERLYDIQKKKKLEVLLENMPLKHGIGLIDFVFPLSQDIGMRETAKAAKEFGLKLTLDTDHLHNPQPQKEPWFNELLPQIGNIHMSSFTKTRIHLPLTQGDFGAREFVQYLITVNYQGLLTIEVCYPGLLSFFRYDFSAIKESVDLIRDT